MEKKYLEEYQNKLSQLCEKEEKLRNLYLRKLANGTYLGPKTNYPAIDKTWLQYYSEDALLTDTPKTNIYEYIKSANVDNLSGEAISFLGKKYTYRELFEKIDIVEKSLIGLGVKKGDIVTIATPNSPENVFLFYAINKIGAVSNFIDPRLKGDMLVSSVNDVNSKLMICSDIFVENLDEVINETTLNDAVVLRISTSFPMIIQKMYNLKNKMPKINSDKIITWNKFLTTSKSISQTYDATDKSLKADETACILHTSGTTGKSKKVMLSNDALNSMAVQYKNIGVTYNRGERFMNQVPPFLGYNIILSTHMPLSLGMTLVMFPEYDPEHFAENVNKNKINHVLAGPADWGNFVDNPKIKKADYSGLITMGSGSDKINDNILEAANRVISEHGGKHKILEGYGQTEAGTAICSNLPNIIQELGVPLFMMTMSVFDKEGNELEFGQEGEICVTGPTIMQGYHNDVENTEATLKVHKDGKKWLHTNDIGIINENGTLTFKGREKRVIVRYDGIKISPFDIEKVINELDFVKDCCVVGVADEEHGRGEKPCCNIVLNDNVTNLSDDEIRNIVLDECSKQLTEKYFVDKVNVMDELPLTPVGKVDFIKLKKICNNQIDDEVVLKFK